MKRYGLMIVMFMFCFTMIMSAQEDKNSPLGYWKTIDDETGKEKSIVKIWMEDGKLTGRIEKLFRGPDEEQDPVCDKCKGERKDKPILGMVFLWDFTQKDDVWTDGKILDPKNGKIYHCKLKVIENGEQLKVTGYIKVLVKIGRSQTWLRVEGV